MPMRFLPQTEELNLFAGRPRSEMEALILGAEERVLKHRAVLYRAGDPATTFAVVVSGAFKLVRSTPSGSDVIVFFATPGDVIGGLVMPHPTGAYPVTAIAMGHSIVLTIPRQTYLKTWMIDSLIQKKMTGMMFTRMSLLHDQKALGKAPLPQKIAVQLVSLIERYSGENETILPIPLTRQEIADSVGATVESVIRVMSDWSQRGIIETSDQLIEILRMDEILGVIKSLD